MTKVIVSGATGYTGLEIIKILLRHPKVEIAAISAVVDKPQKLSEIFPELKNRFDMLCEQKSIEQLLNTGAEVVFLALPHTVSMEFAPHFLKKGMKVIDLSADFRLNSADSYQKYYAHEHKCKEYLSTSVYGLPELFRDKIKNAKLLANPGCFPTAAILSLAPLMLKMPKDITDIIIDAKTGVTGAGRKAALAFHFAELSENIWAYKIGVHQHAPEINQLLGDLAKKDINVLFVPHVAPIKRGIFETIYVKTNKTQSPKDLVKLYKDFYKNETFVRVYDEGKFPQAKDIFNTNFCDIGITASADKIIITSCIDNLIKGAAGQAVQNMNIMCGFEETLGLL